MSDVLDRLRAGDPAADARGWSSTPAGEAVRDRITPSPRRRRSWVLAGAAAVVVLMLVIGVAVVTHATDTSPTKPVSAIQRLVHGTWHRLPDSPLGKLLDAQVLSTDRGILVWGEPQDRALAWAGAIYDPRSRRWARITEPPVALTGTGVWTGSLLVFPRASLAYDAEARRWRSIAQAPQLVIGDRTLIVAAPPGVVVVNAPCRLCDAFLMERGRSAVYDEATDRWTEIPSPPEETVYTTIAATRHQVAIWGFARPMGSSDGILELRYNGWAAVEEAPPATGQSALASLAGDPGGPITWVGWWTEPFQTSELRAAQLVGHRWMPLATSPHRGICAAHTWAGPERSAVVWCSTGERLHLIDTVGNRWFELPSAPTQLQPSVLWSRGSLYALTTDGGLLVLR